MAEKPTGRSQSLVQYAKWYAAKKKAEAEYDKANAKLTELEPQVLDHFEKTGMRKSTLGGFTIYLKEELWAGKIDKDVEPAKLRRAFDDAGMSSYCEPNINVNVLSAWVREEYEKAVDRAKQAKANDLEIDPASVLPEALKPFIKVSRKHKVGALKASKK